MKMETFASEGNKCVLLSCNWHYTVGNIQWCESDIWQFSVLYVNECHTVSLAHTHMHTSAHTPFTFVILLSASGKATEFPQKDWNFSNESVTQQQCKTGTQTITNSHLIGWIQRLRWAAIRAVALNQKAKEKSSFWEYFGHHKYAKSKSRLYSGEVRLEGIKAPSEPSHKLTHIQSPSIWLSLLNIVIDNSFRTQM